MSFRAMPGGLGCTLLIVVASCRSQSAEPAPPAASYELAQAPPGARGARAAGTEAAPAAPNEHELAEPEPDDGEGEGDDTDGGVPDAGVEVDAGPGVAL